MRNILKIMPLIMALAIGGYYAVEYYRVKQDYAELNSQYDYALLRIAAYKEDVGTMVHLNQNLVGELNKKYPKNRKIKLNVISATVTAYNPLKSQTDDSPEITASNSRVYEGVVAVSPDLFRSGWTFGKQVLIGNSLYTIEDISSDRHSRHIDIFMWDLQKARQFGSKQMKVALANLDS